MRNLDSLYSRLGASDAISAVVNDLFSRLMADPELGRFYTNRSDSSLEQEKKQFIDYLCFSAGGTVQYSGRDNKTSHKGMGVNEQDWFLFANHLKDTLDKFQIPDQEQSDLLGFVESIKVDIVE